MKRGASMSAVEASPEQPHGELTVRLVAMLSGANSNGDVFGGWALSQMDQAGGIAAVERARGRVVTIAVEAMTYIRKSRSATRCASIRASIASDAPR